MKDLIPQIETHTRKVLKKFQGYKKIVMTKPNNSKWENTYKNVNEIDNDLKLIKDANEQTKSDILTKIFVAGVDFHADPNILVKS